MKVSRRQFLKVTGIGMGASVLGGQLVSGFSFAEGHPLAFPTPKELGERSGKQVVFKLEATPQTVKIGDQEVQLLAYNGLFPGPTLRMREGDKVQVRFTNSLSEETNLHFHGLHIPLTDPNSETVFRRVAPGETILYEFPIPAGSAGTYWYHPHVHGMTAEHMFRGLAGAIIIEGPLDAVFADLPEQLVILKDFDFNNGVIPDHTRMDWMMGREGRTLSVNGALLPTLNVPQGAVRLRLVNASNARYYRLAVPDANLNVIATDGGYVAKPYALEELLLAPGERYDVVVRFAKAGAFQLMNLPYDRAPEDMMEMGGAATTTESMDGMSMGGMNMATKPGADTGGATTGMNMDSSSGAAMGGMSMGSDMSGMNMGGMNMGGTSAESDTGNMAMGGMGGMESMPTTGVSEPTALLAFAVGAGSSYRLPTTIAPIKPLQLDEASEHRRIVLTENMTALEFFIDGRLFDPERTDFAPKLGTVERWEIVNETGMDHPMHLHVHPFQVYARNGERESDLAWKDVVNVAAGETVDILVPFENFAGRTVFHCHILEHEDLGMMSIVEVEA